MSSPRIYLAPTSNKTAIENLERTVVEGVPPGEYTDTLPMEQRPDTASTADDSPLHIWGTKAKFRDRYDFESGDVLLFYTGDGLYTHAGIIRDDESNPELAKALWGANDDGSLWSNVLYLDPPIGIEIEGSEIADHADYSMNYVLGFQPLNEQGHEGIRDEYGDVPGFLAEKSGYSRNAVLDRSPALAAAIGRKTERDPEPEDKPEPEPAGLSASERWKERCETLGGILERSGQALLWGPDMAVSRQQARQFATEWLDDQWGSVDERIVEASIDETTTYEEFVERVVSSPETNSRITTTDGPFKRACRLANAHKTEVEYGSDGDVPVPRYVLLVELHDGATIEDVLGTIPYLLDPDNRRRELTVQLPHSGESLCVPKNLAIIAVSAGYRSSSIDSKTGTRLPAIGYEPDLELLTEVYTGESRTNVEGRSSDTDLTVPELTIATLKAVNDRLTRSESPVDEIGQDRFIAYGNAAATDDPDVVAGQYDAQALLDIWRYDVVPYLESTTDLSENLHEEIDEIGRILGDDSS